MNFFIKMKKLAKDKLYINLRTNHEMSSIVITDRVKTIMKRWVTVQYPKVHTFLEELKATQDKEEFDRHYAEDHIVCLNIGEIKIAFVLLGAWDKDDEDEIDWVNIYVSFIVSYNGVTIVRDTRGKTMIDLFEIIDNLKEFKLCSICKLSEVEKDDVCINCYPWITTQEDDCCICLDNTPNVWAKLKCSHILHLYCFRKQANRKCPLCRVENPLSTPERI